MTRVAAYAVAFVLLALVGSGRLLTWISPPGRFHTTIGVAEAAAATPTTAASVTFEAAPQSGPDAGTPANPTSTNDGGAADGAGIGADGKVILNLATEQDLRHLSGIGPTRAKAILALRAKLKRFTRVEDLLKVKGFGRKTLARLRPMMRVD